MLNEKAEIWITVPGLHNILVAIFEKPSVWMMKLTCGQGVNRNWLHPIAGRKRNHGYFQLDFTRMYRNQSGSGSGEW
jgi:hypothetical protein